MDELTSTSGGESLARLRRLVTACDRFEAACDRFEAACRAGDAPRPGDYLEGVPPEERGPLHDELARLASSYGLDGRGAGTTRVGPASGSIGGATVDHRAGHSSAGLAPFENLPKGYRLGPYEVEARVGRGGMGVVYRVRNGTLHGRVEALKLLLGAWEAASTEGPADEAIDRFFQEIRGQSGLQHRHIVEVYGAGAEQGRPYFTMRFVDGTSLAGRLRAGPMPGADAAALMRKVAGAVAYLHRKGLTHRDLKPGNIMLDAEGEPYVADFGLARALDDGRDLTLTGTDVVLGSPPYMSPEQALDAHRATERSDVYSLGATLYEAVAGRPPFRAASVLETLRQVIHDDPVSPRRLNPAVSRDLETICLKCLEKDPRRRYASASDLADDLGRASAGLPTRARPVSPPARLARWARRRPGIAGLLAALAVTVATAFAVVTGYWRRAERDAYFGRIAQASDAVAANRADRAMDLLDACPSSLRGWEWWALRRLSHQPPTVVANGADMVYAVAFSPGGDRLATGGRLGLARIWDARDGRKLADLPVVPGVDVRDLAWDRGRIAAACGDGSIRAWAEHGSPLPLPPGRGHRGSANSVAFLGPGGPLLSAGEDGRVLRWDLEAGTSREVGRRDKPIFRVAAHPRSPRFATASEDKKVLLWDLRGGHVEVGELDDFANALAFSPDGTLLASADARGGLRLWDVARRSPHVKLDGHLDGITALAFSPDGLRLASTGNDGGVKLWDVASGREALALRTGASQTEGLAFSPDGHRLAAGCSDGKVVIWDASPGDLASRPLPASLRGHEGSVVHLAISPDSTRIASAGADGRVILWSPDGGAPRAVCDGHAMDGRRQKVNAVTFHPRGDRLVSGGRDGAIRTWGAAAGAPLGDLTGEHDDRIIALAFGPRGELASAGRDRHILLRAPDSGEPPFEVGHAPDEVYALAFDPHGRWVASAGADREVRVWDVDAGRPPRVLAGHRDMVNALAISPDGSRLASAGYDRTAILWDVASGLPLATLRGHAGRVWGVAFSPDGRALATSSGDRTIKLWDVASGRPLATLRGHESRVYSVAFSPDGRFLASASADGLVKVWNLDGPAPILAAAR